MRVRVSADVSEVTGLAALHHGGHPDAAPGPVLSGQEASQPGPLAVLQLQRHQAPLPLRQRERGGQAAGPLQGGGGGALRAGQEEVPVQVLPGS